VKFIADVKVEVMTFPPADLESLTLVSLIFFSHLFAWKNPGESMEVLW